MKSKGLDVLGRLPILAFAGVAIFVLAENGCSGTTTNGAPADAGMGDCAPGAVAHEVGSRTLCCTGQGTDLVCHSGNAAGDPCSGNATASSETINVTLDVCVQDACSGDRTPNSYDAKTSATTQPLVCQNGTFAASGDATVHEVDRVCADVGPLLCSSTTYAYGYGYTTAYGYGYYAGAELMRRTVSVESSVCTTGSAPSGACDVGDL